MVATKCWDQIKDNFIKFDKAYAEKYTPDKVKELEKYEYTDYNITVVLSNFCWAQFLKEKTPENHLSYEEFRGAMEKQLGDKGLIGSFDLIAEYAESRDKYPSFYDFCPRIIEFVNALKIE